MIRHASFMRSVLFVGAAAMLLSSWWAGAGSQADAQWKELQDTFEATKVRPTSVEFVRQKEAAQRRYRDLGLKFYETLTDDPRRWEWLMNTVVSAPQYFLSA